MLREQLASVPVSVIPPHSVPVSADPSDSIAVLVDPSDSIAVSADTSDSIAVPKLLQGGGSVNQLDSIAVPGPKRDACPASKSDCCPSLGGPIHVPHQTKVAVSLLLWTSVSRMRRALSSLVVSDLFDYTVALIVFANCQNCTRQIRTVQRLCGRYSIRLHLLGGEGNIGITLARIRIFDLAVHQGFDLLLEMHDDMLFPFSWFQKLVQHMRPNVAIAMPRLVRCFPNSATPRELEGKVALLRGTEVCTNSLLNHPWLLNISVVHRIGYYDPTLQPFMGEDEDLAATILLRHSGLEIVSTAESVVGHFLTASRPLIPPGKDPFRRAHFLQKFGVPKQAFLQQRFGRTEMYDWTSLNPMDWSLCQRPDPPVLEQTTAHVTFGPGVPPDTGQTKAVPEDKRDPASPGRFSVLVFPIINWDFRFQRPQHFSAGLAQQGMPVYYLSVGFQKRPSMSADRAYQVMATPHEKLHTVFLNCDFPNIYNRAITALEMACMCAALEELFIGENIGATISLVDYPHWFPIVAQLQENFVVYDCMDYHAAFDASIGAQPYPIGVEKELLRFADLVVTSSASLSEAVGVPNVLIRNAAAFDVFAAGKPGHWHTHKPVVGYIGAISHWFDTSMVAAAARRYPEYDFILIGAHHEANVSSLVDLKNVFFKYEQPYSALADMLASFDVAIIPFVVAHPLMHFTNPVKVYEYLSAGKPVVATPIPELQQPEISSLVHLANNELEFSLLIEKAMDERGDEGLAKARQAWAATQTWLHRVQDLVAAVDRTLPLVSIIVLTTNLDGDEDNEVFKCLDSLQKSWYPRLEVLLVNNGITDTPGRQQLDAYASRNANTRIFHQDQNRGFAAGNNIGVHHARGQYIALVNSDVVVMPGWLIRMVRHLQKNLQIGAIGPVTDRIGNEAMVDLGPPTSVESLFRRARTYTGQNLNKVVLTENIAFFCVLFPSAVVHKVGPLDEAFGLGWFEDDDYNRRIKQIGLHVAFAEGAFVMHGLSKTMHRLSQADQEDLFARNRRYFESKWGPWKPHKTREDP